MWPQLLAIVLVLGLLIGSLVLLRRKGIAQWSVPLRNSGRAREIRVRERVALGPQHVLVLVDVRENTFLIGLSPSGCNKIEVLGRGPSGPPETEF
jgi:flagellar biogenesis protein FliO